MAQVIVEEADRRLRDEDPADREADGRDQERDERRKPGNEPEARVGSLVQPGKQRRQTSALVPAMPTMMSVFSTTR